jgi:hypothetical protein
MQAQAGTFQNSLNHLNAVGAKNGHTTAGNPWILVADARYNLFYASPQQCICAGGSATEVAAWFQCYIRRGTPCGFSVICSVPYGKHFGVGITGSLVNTYPDNASVIHREYAGHRGVWA